ncbi:prepilin-type N-terminal cleavage/methylation domain-containing protein [Pseudoduganella sp. UC29_106]|uniref:type IV pilus modification PilV family protein n=1 Tax=Pseudoduganella sp. UC29_106 TaxID=3374553 RepID=UPI0037579342
MKKPLRTTKQQQGVALLEALIAAVILAIGLLGTVGLQARSYAAISDAGQRAEATLAAEELLGIMNNDQANIAAYAVAENATPPAALAPWATKTNGRIPGAKYSVVVTPGAVGARVDVTIRWTRRQGDQQNQHLVTSYIM